MTYPKYFKSKSFLYGDDLALAVVEVDDADRNFSMDELNKLVIPTPAPFDDKVGDKLNEAFCRVAGYPIDVFDPKSGSVGRMEKNPNYLYQDVGKV